MSKAHSPTRPTGQDSQAPPTSPRLPIGPTPKPVALPAHGRSPSAISSRTRPPELSLPSATSPTAAFPRVPTGNPTHLGGVQPAASFFRPSRPIYPPTTHRPPSALSNGSSYDYSEQVPMTPVERRMSVLSDLSAAEEPTSTSEDLPRQLEGAKAKQSREPLLPISGDGGGRPSTQQPALRAIYPGGGSSSRPSLGRGPSERGMGEAMRGSLERIVRGLSFDNRRKSRVSRSSVVELDGAGAGSVSPVMFEPKEPPTSAEDDEASPYRAKRASSVPSRASSAVSLRHRHEYEFVPTPPAGEPPLMAVPRTDAKTGRAVRNYQLHPSRNRFFLGGRMMTGGDRPYAFIASLTLVLLITSVWFGTTCVWWWLNESPAVAAVGAYMCLLSISSILATAFRDPGILPRDLDMDPPLPGSSPSDGGIKAPFPRDLQVRAGVVRVKYCSTCRTYRPPRSSHCKMCDNCVDGCDHHCQWLNNCVGRRNYTTFFVSLFSVTMTLALVIVTSALHLWWLKSRDSIDFRHALSKGAGSAVVFSISILIIWPVTALLVYHLRLLLLNVTTIEQIRNQAHKTLVPGPAPPNPFSHGSVRRNFMNVLCRPSGYSWLNAPAVATEDKRAVNPGLAQWAAHDLETGEKEFEVAR